MEEYIHAGLAVESQLFGTWLDISVKVAMLVHIRQPLKYLVDDASYSSFRQRLRPILDQLVQVAVLPTSILSVSNKALAGCQIA